MLEGLLLGVVRISVFLGDDCSDEGVILRLFGGVVGWEVAADTATRTIAGVDILIYLKAKGCVRARGSTFSNHTPVFSADIWLLLKGFWIGGKFCGGKSEMK